MSTLRTTTPPLVRCLLRELFQTERSATRHPLVEASRSPHTEPARAMAALARHAEEVLPILPELSQDRGLPESKGGLFVGVLFSVLRERMADLVLTRERSYRATLLGLRHGIDAVTLLREAAQQSGDAALVAFCDRWLETRIPLVDAAASALGHFARCPDEALSPVKSTLGAVTAQIGLSALAKLERAVSLLLETREAREGRRANGATPRIAEPSAPDAGGPIAART